MTAPRPLHSVRMLCGTVVILCAAWSAEAGAQSPYPNRMVRLVIPAAAGGPLDISARAIAEKLSINLKQPFVIDNRPGAGGNLGAEALAKAAPDGHTLGMVLGTTLTVNPNLYKKLPFNAETSFRPIAIVTKGGNMLVVHPSLPVNSVAEFVAYARAAAARNEPITYASAGGPGSPGHLVMENFRLRAGFEATHVPYRSNPLMVTDLVAGQVKAAFVTSSGMMDHVQAGRLRPLAVSHAERSPLAPNVPTIAESGYPGFQVENYSVMLAPAETAQPIVTLLERELVAALKLPDIVERLRTMDTAPAGVIGTALDARLRADRTDWAGVIAAANLRIE